MISGLVQRLVVTLSLLAGPALPQPTAHKWEGRVSVHVKADSERLTKEILSYLTRELRSLGDITVTEESGNFDIHVLAGHTHPDNNNGASSLVFSTVVTSPLHLGIANALVAKQLDSKTLDVLLRFLSGYTQEMHRHYLHEGSPDDAPRLAKTIITSIDIDVFQKERNDYQEMLRPKPAPK